MARRGAFQTKPSGPQKEDVALGVGVSRPSALKVAKAATPGTTKAKASPRARERANANAAFKRTGPAPVKKPSSQIGRVGRPVAPSASRGGPPPGSSNVPGTYGYAPPASGLDIGKFFGEVAANLQGAAGSAIPGVRDLQRASGGITTATKRRR